MNKKKCIYKIACMNIFLSLSLLCNSNKMQENQSNTNSSQSDDHIIFHPGIDESQTIKELEKEPQLFTVKFSGFVKPEYFWDSRQNIGSRNDEALVYPEPKELDRCGYDIQAHPEYGMCAIESRIGAEINGPDVLGAKANGYIEADFWGVNEKTLNVFRLRHAYTYLNWENFSFLFGQYWHPLYIPECSPDTIAGNSGVPMNPFKRAPQARLVKRFYPFELMLAVLSEIQFNNDGPQGPNCIYMRNATMPNIAANIQVNQDNNIYGITVDLKRLVPRLKSELNVKVEESILSAACSIYAALNWENFALRLKGTIAQNLADHGMIGGYGVHSIQPESDKRTYTNLQAIGVWADFNRVNSSIEPGCFIGFTKNIGSQKTVVPAIKKHNEIENLTYGFNTQAVDYVFRIQPRIRWFFNPVVFGLELDYTQASYGQPNIRGKITNRPSNIHPEDRPIYPGKTANTRLLFAAFYYF